MSAISNTADNYINLIDLVEKMENMEETELIELIENMEKIVKNKEETVENCNGNEKNNSAELDTRECIICKLILDYKNLAQSSDLDIIYNGKPFKIGCESCKLELKNEKGYNIHDYVFRNIFNFFKINISDDIEEDKKKALNDMYNIFGL